MNRENTEAKVEVDRKGAYSVLVGNASVDGASHRGWFIGHFLAHTCGLRATPSVEIKWGVYSAGEERSLWGTSEEATTLCILFRGRVQFRFPQEDHLLSHEGDYLLWSADLPHQWKILEETCVLTVRWPSVPEAHKEHKTVPDTTMD